MNQLTLPLGDLNPAGGSAFLVGEANADAVAQLDFWHGWPVQAALLVGPPRSGRTLFGRLFVNRTGGRVIDDAEAQDERLIFHAWNDAQASGHPLLIIAGAVPPEWPVALPDLRSRLTATPVLRFQPPDDALLRAILIRGFDRAAMVPAPDVIDWLVRRIDRSYAVIDRIVTDLAATADRSGQRRITVPMVRAWIDRSPDRAIDDAKDPTDP
ncbi:chromosomal replication initiator DnaA [Sphingomonas sp. BGYR3]|uniref:chromosomal replication initiator DnaA n=1 Tax=Sphingomonas sp. BGYR3 TaxID=2975483 RepID=UPI0021A41DC4|nr:chromosomal replication initiator DnaA [Sphingomonas sp. BGYR3]MDG5487168.1 chromosomal replication initiator DnaA [Sphingomonas sp. BGYR3]